MILEQKGLGLSFPTSSPFLFPFLIVPQTSPPSKSPGPSLCAGTQRHTAGNREKSNRRTSLKTINTNTVTMAMRPGPRGSQAITHDESFFFSWTRSPCFASENGFLVSAKLRPCRKGSPLGFKGEAGQAPGSNSGASPREHLGNHPLWSNSFKDRLDVQTCPRLQGLRVGLREGDRGWRSGKHCEVDVVLEARGRGAV